MSWQSLSQTQTWKSWSGYAFENICLQHIDKIKAALGISGVFTKQFSFHVRATDEQEGTQIDLLIDRQDNTVSLCEVKFYNEELFLDKEGAMNFRKKRRLFPPFTIVQCERFFCYYYWSVYFALWDWLLFRFC